MHSRLLLGLASAFLLLLPACKFQYGLPVRGYGYPSILSPYAPRLGGTANFIYYPRYEAYYHPATQMFYYPNGAKWEVKPTVLSNTVKEIRASPSVPFQFPDEHPEKYHAVVKQAFPSTWTTGTGRFNEPYPFGHSGWDLDRR